MNTPTTPNQPENRLHTLPLAMLDASRTNPRKRFDEAKLKELSESIQVQGVLQPLLVREITWQSKPAKTPKLTPSWPFPVDDNAITEPSGRYEIIAGERRYRAAKLAGLTEVPCFVRNLTDLQVLHAQVIENLQRDDLHPLEEAEGYERLIELGSKAEDLGTEIGKSRSYIYARLKLCALVPDARQAFYDGKLDASTALLIARIPVEKLQIQALKKVTTTIGYGNAFLATGDAMSFRAARDLIQQEFMTDLDRAPFKIKDAALLPKAGSCTDCTKRTGNQPELFGDVSSKDVCTDTVCFAMKKTAHIMGLEVKPITASENGANDAKKQAKMELEVKQTAAFRTALFNAIRDKIIADMISSGIVADGLYRILAQRMFDGYEPGYDEMEAIARLHIPNASAEEEADTVIETFKAQIPTLTTQQHFVLMIDMIMIEEVAATRWNYTNDSTIMLQVAKEIGLDPAEIEKASSAAFITAQKEEVIAAKKAAETSSTPTPAAPAAVKAARKNKAAQAPEVTA